MDVTRRRRADDPNRRGYGDDHEGSRGAENATECCAMQRRPGDMAVGRARRNGD